MDRLTELRDEAKQDLETELRDLLPLLSAARGIVSHSPTATISVNAGGLGTWLAATAAIVCFAMTIILTLLYIDQSRQIDDLKDYLSAIYAQAPHLKPEESK